MKRISIFAFALLILGFCLCCNKNNLEQIRFAAASARGDTNLVKAMLKNKNIDINAQNGEIGPALVTASYGGYSEIVNLLLDNGADINIRDKRGTTPLMNAVIGQKEHIVRILLKRGANPNIVTLDESGKGTSLTALTFAKMKSNKEIELLLEEASKESK